MRVAAVVLRPLRSRECSWVFDSWIFGYFDHLSFDLRGRVSTRPRFFVTLNRKLGNARWFMDYCRRNHATVLVELSMFTDCSSVLAARVLRASPKKGKTPIKYRKALL